MNKPVILLFMFFMLKASFCQIPPPPPAGNKIIIYFNRPVDTIESTGIKAVYVQNKLADTLINYINRAKYSLDIAVYDYIQDTTFSDIASAINNAYTRGVKIRWIYNYSSSNTGLDSLNSGIPTLISPSGNNYGIMHNKFMIIDGKSGNVNDPIVWTGSMNWDSEQIKEDVNNVVIIQDQKLAQAYTAEFNQMWGDTGVTPNLSNSKFGPYKTYTTAHNFTIDNKNIELYFSPSDSTNNHILSTINSANSDIFFGVYTFTESNDADAIKAKMQSGVYCAGIMDQYSLGYSAYKILNPVMGNNLKIYTESNSIYHSKYVIIDECDTTSDPQVLTGSHNWSVTADTKNDENTLIIHDATTANIYYQSFYQNFYDLGGTLSPCVITNIKENSSVLSAVCSVIVYPDPASDEVTIQNVQNIPTDISITDITGKIIIKKHVYANELIKLDVSILSNGVFIIITNNDESLSSHKLIIQH